MDLLILAQQAGSSLEYTGQTMLHPVGATVLVLGLIAAFLLPRRYAIVPLIVALAFIPSAQRISIANLDFNIARLMVLGLLFRVTVRGEWKGLRLCAADFLLFAWAGWAIVAYGILFGDVSAFISRSGYMIEAVGGYLVGRACIRDVNSLRRFVFALVLISLPAVVFFMIEKTTGRNMFSVFGGVREFTQIREGRLRCQGSFSHPIMAGVFWASVLPLFVSAVFIFPKIRVVAIVGCATSLLIVMSTSSSTPLMAVILSIPLLVFYRARTMAPVVRWGVLLAIPFLHFSMTHGVHHLLARINVVGGSTGWHRYYLMDKAMEHFHEWMLVGTVSTAHWGRGLQDVTNQFVLEGVRGGMLALLLFSSWLACMFVYLSREIKLERSGWRCLLLWSLGVILFVHCLNFIAVSYFGQVITAFYVVSGLTVSMCSPALRTAAVTARQPALRAGSQQATRAKPPNPKPMGPLHA